MAIYDENGAQLSAAYDVIGNSLNEAYDIDGDIVWMLSEPDLIVMSYNVQWFTGINSQQAMQSEIIAKYHPDIIGFQEFSKTASIPTVGANMLANYPYIQLSNHYNYNAIASKIELIDITIADFQTQASSESETRSYIKAYFTYEGKRICFITAHLCYKGTESAAKYSQMAELFAMAEQEEYCILTGDFNYYDTAEGGADYTGMYKQFVDAGYHFANGTPQTGWTKTWSSGTTASSSDDLMGCQDNIITSASIQMINVVFDLTKLNYLNGQAIDHNPIIAYLEIN